MLALQKSHVQKACIGDIKQTMHKLGEAHIQVVDEYNKICGVISSTDISRVLEGLFILIPLLIRSRIVLM